MSRIAVAALFVYALAAGAGWARDGEDDPSHPVSNLYLTTNLIQAAKGSWVRRYAPGDNSYTTYVADVGDDRVTVQQIRMYRGRVRHNRRIVLSFDYLRQNGVDAEATEAREETVSHNDREYAARVVVAPVGGFTGEFYFVEGIPVNGLVCVKIHPDGGASALEIWTDEYGDTPDDMILDAGPGVDSNDELGIPMP